MVFMYEKNDENVKSNDFPGKIPIWRKFCLTIEEAAQYFGIGENRIRQIVDNNRHAEFVLQVGNRTKIKRTLFENYILTLASI